MKRTFAEPGLKTHSVPLRTMICSAVELSLLLGVLELDRRGHSPDVPYSKHSPSMMGRTIFHLLGCMDELPPLLVVEDEPLIRLTISDALEEGGYNVVESEDGRTAMEQINLAVKLRGLVTDIRMGSGPDGWEVARYARNKFPTLPVVYVSGDSISEWTASGVPQSVALQKPFADAELVTAVANLLVAQQSNPTMP